MLQALGELYDAGFGVGFETVDQVGNDDLEANQIFGTGLERTIGQPLDGEHNEFMIVDFEGDVDRSAMVGISQQQREGLVDRESKVVDCPNGESTSPSDRGSADPSESNKTH